MTYENESGKNILKSYFKTHYSFQNKGQLLSLNNFIVFIYKFKKIKIEQAYGDKNMLLGTIKIFIHIIYIYYMYMNTSKYLQHK